MKSVSIKSIQKQKQKRPRTQRVHNVTVMLCVCVWKRAETSADQWQLIEYGTKQKQNPKSGTDYIQTGVIRNADPNESLSRVILRNSNTT